MDLLAHLSANHSGICWHRRSGERHLGRAVEWSLVHSLSNLINTDQLRSAEQRLKELDQAYGCLFRGFLTNDCPVAGKIFL